jgi:multiple sugar transport system ATP-binding protein
MAEVRLENVRKLYGRKLAVNEVSFTCKEGEFFSILGPTGAGKTTILKMIAGIEPVSSGRIYFNTRPVNDVSPQERNVSMAFESYNLYPHFTAYENIAFPLRSPKRDMKLTPEEERRKVTEIAEFLGIEKLLEKKPQHLSGGEKQRVSLARALVREAEVYLLDEPIAHLDAKLRFSTQTLLKEFASNYGSTIVYVTHDYREALALSDRVVILRKGGVEQCGTPEQIYYRPATDFVGRLVGEPPMNLLDGELDSRGGITCFKAGDAFSIPLRGDLVTAAEKVAVKENGKVLVRLGIRSEDIRVGRDRIGVNSFELPVYAVVREVETSVITFDLGSGFLYARVKDGESGEYRLSETVWLDFDPDRMFFYVKTVEIVKG